MNRVLIGLTETDEESTAYWMVTKYSKRILLNSKVIFDTLLDTRSSDSRIVEKMRNSTMIKSAILAIAVFTAIFAVNLNTSSAGFVDEGKSTVTGNAGSIYTWMTLPSTWPDNFFPYTAVAGQSRTTEGTIQNWGTLDAYVRVALNQKSVTNTALLEESEVELKFDSVSVYKGKFINLQVPNKPLRANQTIAIQFTLTVPVTQKVSDNQWEYQYPALDFISTPVVNVPGYEVLSSAQATLKPEGWRVEAARSTNDPGYFPDGKCLNIQWYAANPTAKKYTLQISTSPTMSNPIEATYTDTAEYSNYMTYKFKNVSPNTTYYYRIRADDAYIVEWSAVKAYTTGAGLASNAMFSCI